MRHYHGTLLLYEHILRGPEGNGIGVLDCGLYVRGLCVCISRGFNAQYRESVCCHHHGVVESGCTPHCKGHYGLSAAHVLCPSAEVISHELPGAQDLLVFRYDER